MGNSEEDFGEVNLGMEVKDDAESNRQIVEDGGAPRSPSKGGQSESAAAPKVETSGLRRRQAETTLIALAWLIGLV